MLNIRVSGRRPGRILPNVRGLGRRVRRDVPERRERMDNRAHRGGAHNEG